MGTKKFTFIELHLDGDTQFGPKTIAESLPLGEASDADREDSSDPRSDSDEDTVAAADDGGNGKGGAVAVLLGLLALVGVAVAVKKFRGGDDEDAAIGDHDEPDIIVS